MYGDTDMRHKVIYLTNLETWISKKYIDDKSSYRLHNEGSKIRIKMDLWICLLDYE